MLYNKTLSLISRVWRTVLTLPSQCHWEAVKPGKSYRLSSASTIPCRVQWYCNEVTLHHHKKLYNPWSNAERICNTGVYLYPPGTQTDVMNWPDEYLAAWPVPYSTVLPSMTTNLLLRSQVSWEQMGFTCPSRARKPLPTSWPDFYGELEN